MGDCLHTPCKEGINQECALLRDRGLANVEVNISRLERVSADYVLSVGN